MFAHYFVLKCLYNIDTHIVYIFGNIDIRGFLDSIYKMN